ncbi:MAG: hypothetical protein A3G45_00350 [Candidatus Staskawiczbacteria bacterium RIFCSPLOWO2_12_FULL_37_15]|uniref:DUF5673 domain-containing protein n=1 Tax=Candidatus Staskawiczbacteria bacterium RIFCSPLOWO2_12_FULL_37_15 TaxID=1802218 RepID=A0A1G2IPE5_9BACT|nr:MAG: hypothetical protein A3G45_00350 [Candidatus Staskawiczbacteria bacterium RIFCSPLOWO2_12_FULL_37_15]HXK41018.1 hypothetical protein [Candidatus Paceibacterota bacterium]
MGKILNLRKQPAKAPQTLQRRREEVKVTEKPAVVIEQFAEKPEIFWEAPSFYYNPQKRYLSLITVALLAGAAALLIFKYDTLTSIFLILASLVLLLYSKQKPTMSKIAVGQSGILVDEIMYYYKDLKSFWIEYNPGGPKELSLESAKWYMPYVKVMLSDRDPVEVRSLIVNFLPEKEHENSLVDHIGRRLGL